MRDLLAATGVYLTGSLLGPVVARAAPSLSRAVLSLMVLALLLAWASGAAARGAGRPEARRMRAAAGVCLGTLVAVLAGMALLPMADNAEGQLVLLVPMATGLLVLLPAAALAEWVARHGRPA